MEYLLSESDRQKIRQLLDTFGKQTKITNTDGRRDTGHITDEEGSAPELYVALTPENGIPPITQASVEPGEGDAPGVAACQVYKIGPNAGAGANPTHFTIRVNGLTREKVFNLSDKEVPGNTWVVLLRDKFGSWVVVGTTESASNGWVAELTGGFATGGAGHGYPWRKMVKDAVGDGYSPDPDGLEGEYAFCTDEDDTLNSPCRGWMFLDPDDPPGTAIPNKYIFLPFYRQRIHCEDGTLVSQYSYDNGENWLLDYDTGIACNVPPPPPPGTIRGPGWVAGIGKGACLSLSVVSVSGVCAGLIPTDQEVYLFNDGTTWHTSSTTHFTYGGDQHGEVVFWIEQGWPHLTIGGIEMVWESAGSDDDGLYIDFTGGGELVGELCHDYEGGSGDSGGSGSGSGSGSLETCDNSFTVRIHCGACTVQCGDFTYPRFLCVKAELPQSDICACNIDPPDNVQFVIAEWNDGPGDVGWRLEAFWPIGVDPAVEFPTAGIYGTISPPCDPHAWGTGCGSGKPNFQGGSYCTARCGGDWSIAYGPLFENQCTIVSEPDPVNLEIELYGTIFKISAYPYDPETCSLGAENPGTGTGTGGAGTGTGTGVTYYGCDDFLGCVESGTGIYTSLSDCEAECVPTGGIRTFDLTEESGRADRLGSPAWQSVTSSVTVPANTLMIVTAAFRGLGGGGHVACPSFTATFDSALMTEDLSTQSLFTIAGHPQRRLYVWSKQVNADTTGSITFDGDDHGWADIAEDYADIYVVVQYITGLTSRLKDQVVSATGAGITLDSGVTGATTASPEYVHGVAVTWTVGSGFPSFTYTWGNGWIDGPHFAGGSPQLRQLNVAYRYSLSVGNTFEALGTYSMAAAWEGAAITYK